MRIGIPKEIKPNEGRVSLVPAAAGELVRNGHEVCLQAGAGIASGYPDLDYRNVGVRVVDDAVTLYAEAQTILKVKEPVPAEYGLLRSDHILFSFLHLAANAELALVLREKGLTAVAFETVEMDGRLPLLAPMSEIAGRLAVQIGAALLHTPQGGRGILLGGLPSADRGHVVVLGAGNAGSSAAAAAAEMGAQVTVFAPNRDALARVHGLGRNVTALPSYRSLIVDAVYTTDLLIGAVSIPGAKTPKLISADMVTQMKPGSVIVDVSVDQGGCIETTRPRDYDNPTYVHEGVIHFAVTNMPGAVPRTASQALSNALVPYVLRLAGEQGLSDPVIRTGINLVDGEIVHPAVAEALA
ncbi:MAG: alanine dehydrogenase [Acidiferrobacterales bacterium]